MLADTDFWKLVYLESLTASLFSKLLIFSSRSVYYCYEAEWLSKVKSSLVFACPLAGLGDLSWVTMELSLDGEVTATLAQWGSFLVIVQFLSEQLGLSRLKLLMLLVRLFCMFSRPSARGRALKTNASGDWAEVRDKLRA